MRPTTQPTPTRATSSWRTATTPTAQGATRASRRSTALGNVGQYTSLALDGAGNPVISYYDVSNTNLKLAHCSDANCTPGNVSSQTVDNVGTNGSYNSLALDAAGNPVISYRDATPANLDLKLAQCSDANCTPGHVNILTVDGSDDVGQYHLAGAGRWGPAGDQLL